ncbi:hypothetical protein HPB50_007900 [Hyalomma asiaticum]|uniref:Uncharacterized protein n=1 Tax=Hyalomma asiaticum TaxID=266040 RepID=A0ACB7TGV2_HYAAI|nr:hypothetical protein HPB50_007900 [Hyalomma asiaticum]
MTTPPYSATWFPAHLDSHLDSLPNLNDIIHSEARALTHSDGARARSDGNQGNATHASGTQIKLPAPSPALTLKFWRLHNSGMFAFISMGPLPSSVVHGIEAGTTPQELELMSTDGYTMTSARMLGKTSNTALLCFEANGNLIQPSNSNVDRNPSPGRPQKKLRPRSRSTSRGRHQQQQQQKVSWAHIINPPGALSDTTTTTAAAPPPLLAT